VDFLNKGLSYLLIIKKDYYSPFLVYLLKK